MDWLRVCSQCCGMLFLLLASISAWAEPLPVFASLLPQKYFIERIGGEHVRVGVMVAPGHSPATYEPTPRQMVELAAAVVYFRIGVPFENVWIDRIQVANPSMRIVDAREGIELREMKSRDHDRHQHGRFDPHIWTAPPLVKIMAAQIRDTLSTLDPAHQDDYESNYQRFAGELDVLDQKIRQTLKDTESRGFMVYHPAWGYFADTYNLEQIPIETEGKQPGAKQLAQLIEQAKAYDIRVIFVQRQFAHGNAETVADAIAGRVVFLDPLAEDYLQNMRTIARAFAEALR